MKRSFRQSRLRPGSQNVARCRRDGRDFGPDRPSALLGSAERSVPFLLKLRQRMVFLDGFSSRTAGRSHRGRRAAAPDQRSGNGRRCRVRRREASNADEAIAILEARSDIHIVFTDIQMPGSMDGLKLAWFVRDRWPPIKLVVTSRRVAFAEGDLPSGGLFVGKPYTSPRIAEVLASLA